MATQRISHQTFLWEDQKSSHPFDLINEEPLSIRIEGNPYTVIMRTPGDEKAHVAGFSLSEGVIDTPKDIAQISFCEEENINVATLTLTPERKRAVPNILNRKSFISQSSCGICGKQIIDDLSTRIKRVDRTEQLAPDEALILIDKLNDIQSLRKKPGPHMVLPYMTAS